MSIVDIKKKIFIKTDGAHKMSVSSSAYISKDRTDIIQSVVLGAVRFQGKKRFYYSPKSYIRYSYDNGKTFEDGKTLYTYDPEKSGEALRMLPVKFLSNKSDLLLMFSSSYLDDPSGVQFSYDSKCMKTYRPFMRISRDRGKSWSDDIYIKDKNAPDETKWAPGIKYGFNGAPLIHAKQMEDGRIIIALTVFKPLDKTGNLVYPKSGNAYTTGVKFAIGRWNKDKTNLLWNFGDTLTVDPEFTDIGCNEPSFTRAYKNKLFVTMRTQGNKRKGLYSRRYCAVSEDNGMTWSDPFILRYDDGDIVHNPASYSNFFTSQATGKTYWLCNILDRPVYGQTPRYPLNIAEFDTENMCIVKDTVSVIQDLPKGAPKERRYTNWSQYEDKDTNELVLYLSELPRYKNFSDMNNDNDMQADCLEYRLKFK